MMCRGEDTMPPALLEVLVQSTRPDDLCYELARFLGIHLRRHEDFSHLCRWLLSCLSGYLLQVTNTLPDASTYSQPKYGGIMFSLLVHCGLQMCQGYELPRETDFIEAKTVESIAYDVTSSKM